LLFAGSFTLPECYDTFNGPFLTRGALTVHTTNHDKARIQGLRGIPSIDTLLESDAIRASAVRIERTILIRIVRESVDDVRGRILSGQEIDDPARTIAERVEARVERLLKPRLHEVINATGVIIHTNLGRAPVSDAAASAMASVAGRYVPLELEIDTGKRGGRMSEISEMLRLLTGADASLVVNNNAAALLLTLSSLCAGGEVILSRSQAVEIGGGFRVPDVMAQSGARLMEVGTTNRTYVRDYEAAINEQTAALLTVHWSNFKIIGFTEQPLLSELAKLASSRSLPLIEDLGSGSLLETTPYGLTHEPTVGESIAAGVDVVCFSGDKLLGGPQAGIISGRSDLVARISRHPLARAVRADKTALAGVAETVRHYLQGDAVERIPVWRMIAADREMLRLRCEEWRARIGMAEIVSVVESNSAIGGGSLPGEALPSWALAIESSHPDRLARVLRTGEPSIMPHIEDGRLLLDARTVFEDQDDALIDRVREALKGEESA
jgi:L-seryl-tRNA(Ser) seleniumtransferase